MSWIQTRHGKAVSLTEPDPKTIIKADIAYSLARTYRYGGHTRYPHSVAEHCVLMSEIPRLDPKIAMGCLLHDAHEAYIGDIQSPVSAALFGQDKSKLEALKSKLDKAIIASLQPGIGDEVLRCAEVRELDRRIVRDEAEQLLGGEVKPWGIDAEPLGIEQFYGWDPWEAEAAWLMRFARLKADLADRQW